MSQVPEDLKYTEDHEWVRVDTDGNMTVGITDFAQAQLGDIVYVDLPSVGATVEAHAECGTVESVKAVSEVFCPVTGEVIAVNEALNDNPEIVNQDPYGKAWFFRLRPLGDLDELMDAESYTQYLEDAGE